MEPETLIPPDLTGLGHADFEEKILPLLEALAENPRLKTSRRVRSVLLNRALILLRTGSRSEIDDESYALYRFLDSPSGERLQQGDPEVFGGLSAVARLLDAASQRIDRAAVDSILRNHKGRGQQVLEAVAAHGQAMPRSLLRSRLEMSESHLSHVLRELEEADLIVRYRPGKGKEVVVDLAHVGREVVERSVLPRWVQHLVDRLSDIAGSRETSLEPTQLAAELHELGAPSRTAAERLATALGEIGAYTEKVTAHGALTEQLFSVFFLEISDRQRSRSPASLLSGR